MARRLVALNKFYPEPKRLNYKEKIALDIQMAKNTTAYKIKGYRNDKQFNVKDIYMYTPSKHIALIQVKSNKEFLIIENLIFLSNVGYGTLVRNLGKIKEDPAKELYNEEAKKHPTDEKYMQRLKSDDEYTSKNPVSIIDNLYFEDIEED